MEKTGRLLEEGWRKLFAVRGKRVRPFRDEKVITGWNGMAISALAKAGRILNAPEYVLAAERTANFILERLTFGDGRLRRSYRDGPSPIPGFLEDYAYFTSGLIDLYEATFGYRWLKQAQNLMDTTMRLFWSNRDGTFFDSQVDSLIGFF